MKIVVLDGKTTNPGDISWKELEALGELTVYDTTPPELVNQRAGDADVIITNRIDLTATVLEALPSLKYIGTLSTGFNTIDLDAAEKRGIVVCNVPGYCVSTVTQTTFALLLALCNHVHKHSDLVKKGKWQESELLSQKYYPFFELHGKTMGILGYGNIGKAVADVAKTMGMSVIAYSKSPKDIPTVTLEELFTKSDVVSIHCALNDETRGIVNIEKLKLLKPGSLIINTARGAVINEEELALALNSGIIAGAGLDVLTDEPPSSHNPLLTAKNCIITPHIAWSSKESRQRLISAVSDNLLGFLTGEIKNRVR